jgi:hypothetical protein
MRGWLMRNFRPYASLWNAPKFLGHSSSGFAAWIVAREVPLGAPRTPTIRQIVEAHHDRNSRTIGPPVKAVGS